jgi:hypothetical protein
MNADYGDMNYATNEAATVALTIRFDNMDQLGADNSGIGIGNSVARTLGAAVTGASAAQG